MAHPARSPGPNPAGVHPPGPHGFPFIGSILILERRPLDFLLELAKRGPIASYPMLDRRVYLLNEPEDVQTVLVTMAPQMRKSLILQRAKFLLGEGLLTSEGQFHLRQRRLIQPAFHRDRLTGYATTMVEATRALSDRWQHGQMIDASAAMNRLTMQIVSRALFQTEVEGEAEQLGEAISLLMEDVFLLALPFSDQLFALPTARNRRRRKALEFLDGHMRQIIEARRASGTDEGDLLSMLLLAQDENASGMSDKQVRDEVITLFLAGHETTANLLAWTWYLLSRNPEVEAKLHAEVDQVLAGRVPTFADLPALRYTEQIVSEGLRLFPPAWVIGRRTAVDFTLRGYQIATGSILLMSPYAMGRQERFFSQPDRFRPERWEDDLKKKLPPFVFFPFGGGPRLCIGERFAWMEAVFVLATLAQNWRLQVPPSFEPRAGTADHLTDEGGLTSRPRAAHHATFAIE